MNKLIDGLKKLSIWKSYEKINAIIEPTFVFSLEEPNVKFYISIFGENDIERFWYDGVNKRTISFEEVFDFATEEICEHFVFNLDLLI